MQLGAAVLHVDWLDGRTLGDWQFVLSGRFPQMLYSDMYNIAWECFSVNNWI
jgi:hypothetical protein